MTDAMSPSQKDDDRQEWFEWEAVRETYHGEPYEPASYYIREKDTKVVLQPALYETFTKQVMADHRDAQQLRERVRVLEEALGEITRADKSNFHKPSRTALHLAGVARAALLRSPAATEGREGA